MKILFVAVGKLKSGPELELFEHYAKRLPWKITTKEVDVKKALSSDVRKLQEAELLLKACEGAEHIIALDEHGKQQKSTEFAAYLQKHADSGARTIAFVIGGADGLHETLLKRAHLKLSLGLCTWPHLLVRGLLAEQLYRAYTILNHHPYHRE